MIHTFHIARKNGRIVCNNCGRRVMPGGVYISIGSSRYCVACEGPGKRGWEALK